MPTQRYLNLKSTGPDPSDLGADPGDPIAITNSLGYEVTMNLANSGVFNPSQGTAMQVPASGKNVIAGSNSSSYTYQTQSNDRALFTGTITIG